MANKRKDFDDIRIHRSVTLSNNEVSSIRAVTKVESLTASIRILLEARSELFINFLDLPFACFDNKTILEFVRDESLKGNDVVKDVARIFNER